jgi:hypothetical protein
MQKRLLKYAIPILLLYVFILFILNHISWIGTWPEDSILYAYPNFGWLILILSESTPLIFFIVSILISTFVFYGVIDVLKKSTHFKFYLLLAIIILITTEIGLRIFGFEPGYKGNSRFFNKVDNLVEFEEYHWDEHGILHFSESHAALISKLVNEAQGLSKTPEKLTSFLDEKNKFDYCSWLLLNDFGSLKSIENSNHLFPKYIKELETKSDLDDVDSAVLEYAQSPVNNKGFKSIDFKKYNSNKVKVLLIGDSFTYGMSAHPVFASFPDILLTKGYVVFNPSFPTNDPENYLQIAKKYINSLNPDIVVVNFYMGNDIMVSDRKTIPYQQHMYPTNAGWIYGEVNGQYFENANDAYNYFISLLYIDKENLYGRFFSQTVLSTFAWMLIERYLPYIFYDDINLRDTSPKPSLSEERLNEIERICNENGATYVLSVIPDIPEMNKSVSDFNPLEIFRSQKPYLIDNIKVEDYVLKKTDGHFNNNGHLKYAEFLDGVITEVMNR